jgi:predicted nucleic acid-binding protein
MIILDTNVLSELMRPNPLPRVVEWIAKQPAAELFTTSITVAEIFLGIELLMRGRRREGLLRTAEKMFAEDLQSRILGFEGEAARLFANIAARRRALGKPISYADAQIAAIARLRGARLATRNIADFDRCEIDLVNPWDGSQAAASAASTSK